MHKKTTKKVALFFLRTKKPHLSGLMASYIFIVKSYPKKTGLATPKINYFLNLIKTIC